MLQPVDAASLAVFRILFGGIMFWEVLRYWSHGWIVRYYVDKPFLFKYYGFEWVHPWPGDGMFWHFGVLGAAALGVATGTLYRLSSVVVLVCFTYIFLLSQARYLNHFYFVILIAALMCVVPAHRYWSVDAWRKPRIRSATVPRWAVWALIIQFEIVLLHAGLVKINPDWLRAQPLLEWFGNRADYAYLGGLLAQEWFAWVASYGAIALHILGAPLLLWRKTRLGVFFLYVGFHLCNAYLFSIGIFPWVTIAATLMFFEPDWPRRVARWLRRLATGRGVGVNAAALGAYQPRLDESYHAGTRTRLLLAALGAFLLFQALFPLRHYLYPGDVAWTEEGHRFAWRMKLRDKDADALFVVRDPDTGRQWIIRNASYLDPRQRRKMATRPDMILQFAHHVAAVSQREWGVDEPEVYAEVRCSLNGRPYALLIDPERDLMTIERNLQPAGWILPMPGGSRWSS